MTTYKITVTRTETAIVSEADSDKILAAAIASGLPLDRLSVKCEQLLDKPQRRVVICADQEPENALDCDFENEDQRVELENTISDYGVWGFVCEQRSVVNGKWEHVDSCFGFVGTYDNNRSMLAHMRTQMPEEFNKIDPIDEHDADREDLMIA